MFRIEKLYNLYLIVASYRYLLAYFISSMGLMLVSQETYTLVKKHGQETVYLKNQYSEK